MRLSRPPRLPIPTPRGVFAAVVVPVVLAVGGWHLRADAAEQRFPDVLSAVVRAAGPGVFDFDVTISSPYDTPARYADGFRVSTPDGAVLGERTLWHDHRHEQPFTRDLYAVRIPPGIAVVVVQARDRLHGYGGKTVDLRLPGR